MARDYRKERDALVMRFYGAPPPGRNPRPRRSWSERGTINPAGRLWDTRTRQLTLPPIRTLHRVGLRVEPRRIRDAHRGWTLRTQPTGPATGKPAGRYQKASR